MALLNQIVEEGRRFANTADMQVERYELAKLLLVQRWQLWSATLKVMSAVQARIHYSLKQELNLLKGIIAEYTPEEYSYEPVEGSRRAKKSDYENVDVLPVSDPNASTMAQKIVQYQAALQLAQTAPQTLQPPTLASPDARCFGIKNAQKLIPMEEDFKPT